jgi:transcriptional regulator with XRE-family HTH domain
MAKRGGGRKRECNVPGEQLAQFRIHYGAEGQKELAARIGLGVTAELVGKWERNSEHPSGEKLTKILELFSHAYKVPAQKLLDAGFSEGQLTRAGIDLPPAKQIAAEPEVGPEHQPVISHPAFLRPGGIAARSPSPRHRPGEPYKLTILCDFDGTMTESDTTDDILKCCADPMWNAIEVAWEDHKAIWSRECMLFQAMCIPADDGARIKINDCLAVQRGIR